MPRIRRCLLAAALGVLLLAGAGDLCPTRADEGWDEAAAHDGLYAVLETDHGQIVCSLLVEWAPLTVANFVGLAEGTRETRDSETGETSREPFYDGMIIHRVIQDFMIQTGDPTGTGTGGPGYRFRDELDSGLSHDRPGTLSMANAGPNTNGSQFYITEVATPWLDGKHSVFGRVLFGMDVVHSIAASEVEGDRPKEDIELRSVRIVRKGDAAEDFDAERAFHELKDLSEIEVAARRTRGFQLRVEELRKGSAPSPDGSRFTIARTGEGDTPSSGQTIRAHYVCYLPDGTVVESTHRRRHPARLVAGEPRRGLDWEMHYLEMSVGERRWVFLPPELGFGERGIPGVVPPNSALILDLELESIVGE